MAGGLQAELAAKFVKFGADKAIGSEFNHAKNERVKKTRRAQRQTGNWHKRRRAGAWDHPGLENYRDERATEFFVDESGAEDGGVRDEDGIGFVREFSKEAIVGFNDAPAPVCGVAGGF